MTMQVGDTGTHGAGAGLRVAVVGAGVVGVCCALYLQRAGCRVTVFDPQGPGEGASAGNAGLISPGSVTPMVMPRVLLQVPAMLLHPLGPLRVRPRYVLKALPYLLRIGAASAPGRVTARSDAMAALHRPALDDLLPLAEAAGAADLLRHEGRLEVYTTEAHFAADEGRRAMMGRQGVACEVLGADAARQAEPALGTPVVKAVRRPESAHALDPLALVQRLAAHFQAEGGTLVRAAVRGLEGGPDMPLRVRTDDGAAHEADRLVVAAGARSGPLAARFGARVPLEAERGYSVTLPEPGFTLRRPVSAMDHHFSMTPMAMGLRLGGTVEFAGVDAPADWARADALVTAARHLFPQLNAAGAQRWMGCRPALPDELPVIGPAPGDTRVLLAFGHGHLGLTGAATTGRMVAALATGQAPHVDPAPFRPQRF